MGWTRKKSTVLVCWFDQLMVLCFAFTSIMVSSCFAPKILDIAHL